MVPSACTIFHADPGVHWLSQCVPNQYRFMNSASSVSADHSFSGVVRMYVTYTNVDLAIGSLQSFLQIGKCLEARLLELGDPALMDFLQRHRVEKVQLFPATPHGGDQIGGLQDVQVLCDSLAGHLHVFAELVQRAAVMRVQEVQKLSPARIGEGLEERVSVVATDHL